MSHFARCTALIATICISLLGATPSHARMMLSADGMGQVLHYPYYTVNGGYATLISIVNNGNDAKAVRVRFLESKNGRITYEFDLFLSPRDVWTGALKMTAQGLTQLEPNDRSCTFPEPTFPQTILRRDALAFDLVDGQIIDNSVARTTQGFVEVIEMGVITNAALKEAITHVAGIPKDCSLLNKVYVAGSDVPSISISPEYKDALSAPTGKLSGTGTLINVPQGTDYSYDAVAIDGVFTQAQHFAPVFANDDRTSRPSLRDATTKVTITDQGKTYFAEFADGLDAVSALYQRASLSNEQITSAAIGAGTDFVIAMPTRRYHMGKTSTEIPRAPFSVPFGVSGAPEAMAIEEFDRDELTTMVDIDLCTPPPPPSLRNDCSVSVYTVRNSNVLGSPSAKNELGTFAAGSAKFYFHRQGLQFPYRVTPPLTEELSAKRFISTVGATNRMDDTNCKSIKFYGFPVMGFAVQKYVNGNVNGVLSNYGGLFQHKYERLIECVQ